MAQKGRREYDWSPHRTYDVENLMDEIDFMDQLREAKFKELANDMKSQVNSFGSELEDLKDRANRMEEMLVLQQTELGHNAALNQTVLQNIKQLQEVQFKNIAATTAKLEKLSSDSERLAKFQEGCEQRLSKLEDRSVGSGNPGGATTSSRGDDLEDGAVGSGSQRRAPVGRGKKSPCPFCAKELAVTYLRAHLKKHCKKTPAAAARGRIRSTD